MGDKFLAVTSLENWSWGETSILAVLILIGVLTMRSVVERDEAIFFGKPSKARVDAYEARWRSGGMTDA